MPSLFVNVILIPCIGQGLFKLSSLNILENHKRYSYTLTLKSSEFHGNGNQLRGSSLKDPSCEKKQRGTEVGMERNVFLLLRSVFSVESGSQV